MVLFESDIERKMVRTNRGIKYVDKLLKLLENDIRASQLLMVSRTPGISVPAMARLGRCGSTQAYNSLHDLKDEGLVFSKKGKRPYGWYLTESGELLVNTMAQTKEILSTIKETNDA